MWLLKKKRYFLKKWLQLEMDVVVNWWMTFMLSWQDDDDEGDDDDEDDGFFVPHGYLSDGEGALEDEVYLSKVIFILRSRSIEPSLLIDVDGMRVR